MTITISGVDALQILDSRGRPTVQVTLALDDGARVDGFAPSGASTGEHEAVERRDGGTAFGGAGVSQVVDDLRGRIAEGLTGHPWATIGEVDALLRDLDGTETFAAIGSNAAVAVSTAAARAFAHAAGVPLWRWIADLTGASPRLPVPHFNVINGGAHAPNALAFQEFMVAPVGAATFADALRTGAEVYAALRARLQHAGHQIGVGDEGGFAPDVHAPERALHLLVDAIGDAGYTAGVDDVAIAMDPAANGFGTPGGAYTVDGPPLPRAGMLERYAGMLRDFPVRSIEDPFHEGDAESWQALTARVGNRVQVVGDDLFVTSAERIADGAAHGLATAALIKPNQCGTVTGTFEAVAAAGAHGLGAMVSHRSGETVDTFIADLAVGIGVGQLKSGAPARGERVAKYNRLAQIEARNPGLPYGLPEQAARR